MDEGAPLLEPSPQRLLAGLVVAVSMQDDLGPEAARSRHLDLRRRQGHHNLRPDPARRGVKGDSLRVVAGAGRDHPALPLRLAQGEQLVQRAPLLERAGPLQVFQLQMQWQAGQLRQLAGKLAGRDIDRLPDARPRRLNAGKGDRFQDLPPRLKSKCGRNQESNLCGR